MSDPLVRECVTADCGRRATRVLEVEDTTGTYPYCDDCADLLIKSGLGEERGPVDDPVVAERDRYRAAVRGGMTGNEDHGTENCLRRWQGCKLCEALEGPACSDGPDRTEPNIGQSDG